MDAKQYAALNGTYRECLVFHLGYNAGFFTEFTYMVNAMIYCLDRHLCFKLYSEDANFGTGTGWNEFFMPFCEDEHNWFHHRFNFHRVPDWGTVLRAAWQKRSPSFLVWKCKYLLLDVLAKGHCAARFSRKTYLTQDISFDHRKRFSFPELDFEGDYLQAFRELSLMIWRFNADTEKAYREAMSQLSLPQQYVGCQIRGGDKITETELVSHNLYLDPIRRQPEQCVFLLTDDYRNFEALRTEAPDHHWLTLCQPDERGYDHKQFVAKDPDFKRRNITKLLVSVQILMDASSFIGSITCGPSVFLMKLKYPEDAAIDCAPEKLKDVLPLDIVRRGAVAREFLKSL